LSDEDAVFCQQALAEQRIGSSVLRRPPAETFQKGAVITVALRVETAGRNEGHRHEGRRGRKTLDQAPPEMVDESQTGKEGPVGGLDGTAQGENLLVAPGKLTEAGGRGQDAADVDRRGGQPLPGRQRVVEAGAQRGKTQPLPGQGKGAAGLGR
jgi:hypothetical protein